MLRIFRKYFSGTFSKAMFGFLALLFIWWGVGSFSTDRLDLVAEVHGKQITRAQLDRAEALLQRRYEQMLRGMALPKGFNLRGQARDQLIDQALLQHEAARLGIEVTESEVIQYVTEMPDFQENGRFSRDLMRKILEANRDRGEFEEQVRNAILGERIQNLVGDGVQIADAELKERFQMDHEQVNLQFVKVVGADLAKDVALSDDELQKYLTEHGDRYRVPTKVRARYVAYRSSDFADQAHVSDTQIGEYYEQNKDTQFATPEQVKLRQILVKSPTDGDETKEDAAKKKAEDLLAKIKGGQDFAAIAKASSDDTASAANGGDIGAQSRQSLGPELAAAAFALEAGGLSDVVEGPLGFYLLKADEKIPAGIKPLDTVRDEITKVLKDEKGLDMARAQVDADRRSIVRGKSLAEAVGNRKVQETGAFAENDPIGDVGRLPEFNKAALALGDGEPSNPIEGDGVIYLLTPFERVEAHVPALDAVRDRVLADARRDKGQALAKDKAEALLAKAKELGGLEKAAADAGLTIEETGAFDRRTGPKGLFNPDLRTDPFALTKEQPIGSKAYTVGNDAVVIALKERIAADLAGFDKDKDTLRSSLLQQKRTAAMTKFMDLLKQRAGAAGALRLYDDGTAQS